MRPNWFVFPPYPFLFIPLTKVPWGERQGYKYSVFNLVFANNPASSRIWDRLGFQVLGRVPGAGRLANSEELVDALIYGRSLV